MGVIHPQCGEPVWVSRSERGFMGDPTGNLRTRAETSGFRPPKAFGGIYRFNLPLG